MSTAFLRRMFAGFSLVLLPMTASAGPVVITDTMDSSATYRRGDYGGYASSNFVNRAAGGRHWGDELFSPGHRFDTSQIAVDRAANAITFTIRTMFNGNDLGARYADLFIDTATPGTLDGFNYAIALGGQTLPTGVYSVSGRATSNDVWGERAGYVYGGYSQFKPTSPDYAATMAVENPVRVTSGTRIDAFSVVISTLAAAGGYTDLIVAVTGDSHLFSAMDLFWATGDCGNDVVWGTALTRADAEVRAPSSFVLFLAGTLLLLSHCTSGVARRRNAQVHDRRA
ncbi:MAG: hypothetical protein AB7E79_09170 [Rhodospirillaceae bacterium]